MWRVRIRMETKSTINNVLDIYKRVFLGHPVRTVILGLVYIAGLWYFGILQTPSWFTRASRLEITIKPTERYGVGNAHLTLKRIEVINDKQAIENLQIEIRAPRFINEVSVEQDMQERCRVTNNVLEGFEAIYQVRCSNVSRGQVVVVTLSTSHTISTKERIQVVAVETDEKGKQIAGNSATGSID